MDISRKCPMCGDTTSKEFKEDEKTMDLLDKYFSGQIYVQELPYPPNVREFLKTGYCDGCQALLFGTNE